MTDFLRPATDAMTEQEGARGGLEEEGATGERQVPEIGRDGKDGELNSFTVRISVYSWSGYKQTIPNMVLDLQCSNITDFRTSSRIE
jgi:hypothetical protein